MENIQQLTAELLSSRLLIQATLSQLRKSDPEGFSKVIVKPVELKGALHYQFSYFYGKKVKHDNLLPEEAERRLGVLFADTFRQGLYQTASADYQILISKKNKAAVLKKPATKQTAELAHNRKKQYVLEEGRPVPFLVELGVMSPEGRVLAKKYDKFRQINRFVEMIADVVQHLPTGRTLRIVDFGCGKSYLTFALYYYLKDLQGFDIEITGLDLKEDVIRHCSELAGKLGCDRLHFRVGDIADYSAVEQADMVVTLHACDTATDAALEKAVRWNASVIMSVPCCQHELMPQVKSSVLSPMLEHGIIKERFASLATDAVRARLLEMVGYRTQLVEFIDMEHTPKNVLIRAVKAGSADVALLAREYLEFKRFLHIDPYLERALHDRLAPLLAAAAGEGT
ncbi:class I SAM-dependent methyltransferase [Paenibacillus thalictri]|uniref:SAM-dependent methyltransferase n=1 Tax=Paenibacillus thalictri TaxID=2527873 RepID=A0A4Q9DI62_9BACL|nr:SAM-dependent methyltransferase [Paenibacillus thalictri]TBL72748.1 SAM-dependent methyltransferase [Paenibacillus thalictri]